jgi:hypothetical protein
VEAKQLDDGIADTFVSVGATIGVSDDRTRIAVRASEVLRLLADFHCFNVRMAAI